jgi:hypothetical protein
VDDDPVAAWQIHCAAVQALLDDPATADQVLANPHIGALALHRAIDQFYTAESRPRTTANSTSRSVT